MLSANLPFLILNRLKVSRRGHVAYDEKFHAGVNIIRGENGSGKSTISDFIFYILGGEFGGEKDSDKSDWKDAAEKCDVVQAEISTTRGTLTLRRNIGKKLEPIFVFFGKFEDANKQADDGWERFPIRRVGGQISFSQMMFRSIKIPEAQSEGASNITMHQIMRLLYSDQRTPAPRLFRYESFDTQNIREAVGELICGVSGYARFEVTLKLRAEEKKLGELQSKFKTLIAARPEDEAFNSPIAIKTVVSNLKLEGQTLLLEIEKVDEVVQSDQTKEFAENRQKSLTALQRSKQKMRVLESTLSTDSLEEEEIRQFLEYLMELHEKVSLAENTSSSVGFIEFSHCPACLNLIEKDNTEHACHVCGCKTDPEADKSKYNQIRLDLEIQTRETRQLLEQKYATISDNKIRLRTAKREYKQALHGFSLNYDISSSPREAFLATRNNRLGQIEGEVLYYERGLKLAEEIESAREAKESQETTVTRLKDELKSLEKKANIRKSIALTKVSNIAAKILKMDLNRQEEFEQSINVSLNFKNDAIQVDGKTSFAESSNVFF